MQVRKRYQNGGGVPGGDPKRQAEQLAFAQLLQDEAFKKKLEEKMRLRDEYGVYADDPAGLPSTDPFLALTAAGDAEAIGSGLAEMSGGDVLTGGANVGLGMASIFLPGTLPKVKKIGKTTLEVKPKAQFPDNPVVLKKDDATLGYMYEGDGKVGGEGTIDITISGDAARAADTMREKQALEKALLADPNNVTLQKQLDAKNRYINSFVPEDLRRMEPDEISSAMAKGTMAMLQEVPVGKIVGAESVSTDSYAMMLKRWAKGQLSAKRFDGMGDNHQGLNQMGKKYKNSPEVEQWQRNKYEGDPKVKGLDEDGYEFDNTYAPKNQMDFQEFMQVDPKAKDAYRTGNMARAEDLYGQYKVQADNNVGVSSFGRYDGLNAALDQEEAQELADIFNRKMRAFATDRPRLQERGVAKSKGKAKVSDDLGIPEAIVVQDPDQTRYLVQYPVLPFHRNFNYGGKFKIKKKRRPGMQVKR